MSRRAYALLGAATGVVVGSVLFRRSSARRRDRVDVYFDDGSLVSLVEGSQEADRLLGVARDALAAARPVTAAP